MRPWIIPTAAITVYIPDNAGRPAETTVPKTNNRIMIVNGAEINSASFLGYPLAYYMTAQGSLLAFVLLIFWFANRQEKIDEECGFGGEDD